MYKSVFIVLVRIGLFLLSKRVIKRGVCIMCAILFYSIVIGLFKSIVVTSNASIISSSLFTKSTPYSYPQF